MSLTIRARSARSAATLASILDAEGHATVWYQSTVVTTASPDAAMACIATTETVLGVPAAQRTVRMGAR